MSTRATSKSKSKQKPSPVDTQAKSLHSLCRNLVHKPEAPAAEAWWDQAVDLTDKTLRSGRDRVFEKALALAEDAEVFGEIESMIEMHAETGALLRSDGSAGFVSLFAVPVVLTSIGGVQIQHLRLEGESFGGLVKSFKTNGLMNKEVSVFLGDYLYHHSELDLTYSVVSRMAEPVMRSAAGERIDPKKLARTGKKLNPYPADIPVAELYFLLGAYIDQMETGFSFPPQLSSEAEIEQYVLNLQTWHESAQTYLSAALPAKVRKPVLLLGEPDHFYTALKSGRTLFADTGFGLLAGIVLNKKDGNRNPENVAAIVACYANEDGSMVDIGATLMSKPDGDMIAGVSRVLLPHEEIDIAIQSVIDTLGNYGVTDITVEDEPAVMGQCACCGERTCLVPDSNDSAAASSLQNRVRPQQKTLH